MHHSAAWEAEELDIVTADRSTAVSEDCDPALIDFAFNLYQKFAAVRARGEGIGEVLYLVAAHILSRPAPAFPAIRTFAYIDKLALDTVRDQGIVLTAELVITVVGHDIDLEGPLAHAATATVSVLCALCNGAV